MPRVRTVPQAAAWIDQVGLALLLPKADVVLPSLWEQVNGSPERSSAVPWPPEMEIVWGAKDELPAQGLACVGRHAARAVVCVAPGLVPVLAAAAGDPALDESETAVAHAVDREGPLTAPQLRALLGLEKRAVERAVAGLQRKVVLTGSHLVEHGNGWGALAHDLVARKWPGPAVDRDGARSQLAETVLASAGELTAADLRGVFGWRPKDAAAVLDTVASSRDGGGFRIWMRP